MKHNCWVLLTINNAAKTIADEIERKTITEEQNLRGLPKVWVTSTFDGKSIYPLRKAYMIHCMIPFL